MIRNINNLNAEALDALVEELTPEPKPFELQAPHAELWKKFKPKLNPTQQLIYDTPAVYTLAHGERGSGKSVGALWKLVRHCYEENNALAMIIVGVKRQAEEGGIWHKLQTEVLPKLEAALGLDHSIHYEQPNGALFTDQKTNTAKDIFIWMKNMHGGWSRILLLSMPVEGFVAERVKGMEPSFILIDEAQTLESDTYFSAIVQQLGRRPGIIGRQQIVYCANPAGPSHWLYFRFFLYPVDKDTGLWNPDYAEFHVPIQENIHNLPPDYWKNVIEATRNDPIEEARMLRGEWIDRPTGAALFGEDFIEAVHIRGNAAKNIGLHPVKGYPMIVSYDLGAAHTSIHFKQIIPTTDKIWKLIIDELDYVGKYMPYVKLVPKIIARMEYWDAKMGVKFDWFHVSDNSAFNQYRAKEGSFDVWDIETISAGRIKLRECPKGPHSVEARVRLLKDALQQEELIVSATCTKTKGMLLNLVEDEKDRLKPKRGPDLHRFDSATYGFMYFLVGRGRFKIKQDASIKPEVYAMGQAA